MRYLIKFITLLFLVALLSGCTTSYEKPGGTQQSFAKDHVECLALCGQAAGDQGCNFAHRNIYKSCLLGRGWKPTAKP